jgi:hypothetical protein
MTSYLGSLGQRLRGQGRLGIEAGARYVRDGLIEASVSNVVV